MYKLTYKTSSCFAIGFLETEEIYKTKIMAKLNKFAVGLFPQSFDIKISSTCV